MDVVNFVAGQAKDAGTKIVDGVSEVVGGVFSSLRKQGVSLKYDVETNVKQVFGIPMLITHVAAFAAVGVAAVGTAEVSLRTAQSFICKRRCDTCKGWEALQCTRCRGTGKVKFRGLKSGRNYWEKPAKDDLAVSIANGQEEVIHYPASLDTEFVFPSKEFPRKACPSCDGSGVMNCPECFGKDNLVLSSDKLRDVPRLSWDVLRKIDYSSEVAETRFASNTIVLRRLVKVREPLASMVISQSWSLWRQSNTERATNVKRMILDDTWWERVEYLLSFTEPIMSMIRYTDTDHPCLGEVYDGIDSMLEKMKHVINEKEQDPEETFFKEVQTICVERWNKMTTPLHLLAFALTPKFYSDEILAMPSRVPPYRDAEVSEGCRKALAKLFPDREMENIVTSEFADFVASNGQSASALCDKYKKDAHAWWYLNGHTSPHLQTLAIKLLSQNILASMEDPSLAAYWLIAKPELEGGFKFDEDVKQKIWWKYKEDFLRYGMARKSVAEREPGWEYIQKVLLAIDPSTARADPVVVKNVPYYKATKKIKAEVMKLEVPQRPHNWGVSSISLEETGWAKDQLEDPRQKQVSKDALDRAWEMKWRKQKYEELVGERVQKGIAKFQQEAEERRKREERRNRKWWKWF